MKKLAFILSLFVAAPLMATNVSFSTTSTGPRFVTTTGSVVPNGSLVVVGRLTEAGNPTTFVEFGRTTLNTVFGQTGRLGGATTNLDEADDDAFNGANVWIWVYNSTTADPNADQALFRATAGTPLWTFPANGGATDLVTLGMAGVDVSVAPPANGGITFAGNAVIPANAANAWGNFTGLMLAAPIPEPSVSLMASLVGLGLLARRRR
jgi:hypothetical protein